MKTELLLIICSALLSAQVITTAAGTSWVFPPTPLAATTAPLGAVSAVAIDSANNVYIADTQNNLIEKVAPSGDLTVVAGNGFAGYAGDGGPATSAELHDPEGVAVDAQGNLYVADFLNYAVRKITPSGVISTLNPDLVAARAVAVDNSGTSPYQKPSGHLQHIRLFPEVDGGVSVRA